MIWTTSWELLKRNRAQLLRGAEGIQCEQLSAQVRVASNKQAPNTEEFQLFTNKGLFFLKSDLFKNLHASFCNCYIIHVPLFPNEQQYYKKDYKRRSLSISNNNSNNSAHLRSSAGWCYGHSTFIFKKQNI